MQVGRTRPLRARVRSGGCQGWGRGFESLRPAAAVDALLALRQTVLLLDYDDPKVRLAAAKVIDVAPKLLAPVA